MLSLSCFDQSVQVSNNINILSYVICRIDFHLVNVIRLKLFQSDHIKEFLYKLYFANGCQSYDCCRNEYFYHSVIVIRSKPDQSDHIKELLRY